MARAYRRPRAGARLTTPLSVAGFVARRTVAGEAFFGAEAERIARLCAQLAEGFGAGGRLLALGSSPQDRSDAHHVAVEFVHPVIVGKRALPALAVDEAGLRLLARPGDMVIAFGGHREELARAAELGCVTVGFGGSGAAWDFTPPGDDPFVRQELVETLYHLLWELVHVFVDHGASSRSGAGASAFLYPFLELAGADGEAVVDDVRHSVRMKAEEVGALRARTLEEGAEELAAAAEALRAALGAGGNVLAFGNGGSATDAMDFVADLRAAPQGWGPRAALDLTEHPAILTAVANDVGPDLLFARQLIAYGRAGDVAVALSTSGSSANIVEALIEARRRGLATIAFVGYDGGRVAAERLADHIVVTPSEHIPRIQEAQASAYHCLRELVEQG